MLLEKNGEKEDREKLKEGYQRFGKRDRKRFRKDGRRCRKKAKFSGSVAGKELKRG
jgi:hypothetical protein